ncbi:hypothetical protein Hanom_Chr13g01208811 [Helianthus anomalus]
MINLLPECIISTRNADSRKQSLELNMLKVIDIRVVVMWRTWQDECKVADLTTVDIFR